MRRRDFIAIVAGIAALPLAALAQQADPSIAPQVHEEMWAIPLRANDGETSESRKFSLTWA